MKFRKKLVSAMLAGGVMAVSGQASAHSYYNLNGSGSILSGDSAMGFGIANSINGTDGVVAGRTADGTNTYKPTSNTFISGTGTAASSITEVTGTLPYMWYSGQHSTAAGFTKRELYTGSSVTDNTGNLFAQTLSGASPVTPGGIALPGTNANWGANNLNGLWKAYNNKNGFGNATPGADTANATTWGTIMADLPANGDRPYLAVAGTSSSTGLGLDYGLIHISCGANTAINNCATSTPVDADGNPTGPSINTGDVFTTITIANDKDYSQYGLSGLLDVALYRGADSSLSSNRTLAADITGAAPGNIQGSNLGDAIWTAHMTDVNDILSYSFIFNQAEWLATDTAGASKTNGFYTLVIGGRGGLPGQGFLYDAMITTSAAPVPVPAAVWLFGSAMAGMIGFGRRKQQLAG